MTSEYWTFPREYWLAFGKYRNRGQRHGQATFNAVYELWPNVANSLRGSTFDPFYDDSKVDLFLDSVLDQLTKPGS